VDVVEVTSMKWVLALVGDVQAADAEKVSVDRNDFTSHLDRLFSRPDKDVHMPADNISDFIRHYGNSLALAG
jgi:hypothetical protein